MNIKLGKPSAPSLSEDKTRPPFTLMNIIKPYMDYIKSIIDRAAARPYKILVLWIDMYFFSYDYEHEAVVF